MFDLIAGSKLTQKQKKELSDQVLQLQGLSSAPTRNAAHATERLAEDIERLISHGRVELAGAYEAIVKLTGIQTLAALPQHAKEKEETNG